MFAQAGANSLRPRQLVKKVFLTSWWTGEQAIHNSQWSPCCAWRLAVFPPLSSAWSLRVVRKLTRGAPCFTGLIGGYCSHWLRRLFRPHWAYFALLRPTGRALRAPPRHCHPQFAMVVPHLRTALAFGGAVFRGCALRFASCARHSSPLGLRCAALPCSLGLLRPVSATGGGLRAPPYQFPLKSCGFSGAETARKRFLLWKMGFSVAKIAPSPLYTPPGAILMREGFGPLALSWGFLTVWSIDKVNVSSAIAGFLFSNCMILQFVSFQSLSQRS